ncbi:uncharacterized protein LOC123540307 isoform X2 [Mercenaria mercenaria]|uniref:uncharacterized protein LOC123540307 isoform X2 n=1 Tax=Mercenaria mercenaria TaxID=6596 RepID=UPI00234F5C64|nr:uncharacterized protein LOC123540307 isoform X2 [Mercenaria mercenaria]
MGNYNNSLQSTMWYRSLYFSIFFSRRLIFPQFDMHYKVLEVAEVFHSIIFPVRHLPCFVKYKMEKLCILFMIFLALKGIRFHDEGTTVVDMTTESTQTTTETAETALPHSTTKTQSSTEAASTRTQITEESLISGTKDTAKTESLSKEIVYIAVPVVIVVSGAIAVLICLIVRRRRVKRECSVRYHTDNPHPPGHNSEVDKNAENDSLIENPNDNQLSTKLRVENSTSAADSVTEYNTVYSAGSPQSVNTYSCLRTHPGIGLTTSSEYSHMKVITTTNPIAICTDNTYSHIGDDSEIGKKSREQSTENVSERDNTYNTLQASPQKHAVDKISRSEGDPDTVYDHATHAEAGVGYQKGNTADEYEHLNSIKTGTVTAGQCNIAREKVNLVCESLDSESNGMYEEAGHNYFILEPKT